VCSRSGNCKVWHMAGVGGTTQVAYGIRGQLLSYVQRGRELGLVPDATFYFISFRFLSLTFASVLPAGVNFNCARLSR
jgi:hypothetical protein